MFLDNVTTILLMTPITIKLFECLCLNPAPILPFIILNINIAGLTTLIGHPPNLLITGNNYISKQNITFFTFTMHMCFGVFVAIIQTNCHLRIQHRNIQKILASSKSNVELRSWQKCLESIKSCTLDERFDRLKTILERKIEALESIEMSFTPFAQGEDTDDSFKMTLRHLKKLVSSKNGWETN